MSDARTDEAKRPLTVLAGPYGHPFHPILVTVPIGAWVASFVFDLASRWAATGEVFPTGARWLIALGVAGALVAAMFGFLDLLAIPSGTPARRTAVVHALLNLLVTSLFVTSLLLRNADRPVGWGVIVLSAAALTLLGVSGWLGGKLTYRYGVRVVDEATQRDGYTRS